MKFEMLMDTKGRTYARVTEDNGTEHYFYAGVVYDDPFCNVEGVTFSEEIPKPECVLGYNIYKDLAEECEREEKERDAKK